MRSICIALCVLFLSNACGGPKVIKIGFTATLTGPSSHLGHDGQLGAEFAVAQINAEGGIKGKQLQLVIKDDKNTAPVAAANIAFFQKADCIAVIGPFTSSMSSGIPGPDSGPNIPVLSPTISTLAMSGIPDHFIRFSPETTTRAWTIFREIKDKKYKKITCIHDLSNARYTVEFFNSLRTLSKEESYGRITGVSFNGKKQTDYNSIAADVMASNPDAIVFITNSLDTANIAQQLYKSGNKAQLFSSFWARTYDLIHYGGRAVEGMLLVSEKIDPVYKAAYEEFSSGFRQQFSRAPSFSVVYSYETTTILLRTLRHIDTFDPQTIIDSISGKSHTGLMNTVYIDKYGDCSRDFQFSIIKNGNFVQLDEHDEQKN